MKRFFDSELETFRSHLLMMGEKSMEQVRQALKALVEKRAVRLAAEPPLKPYVDIPRMANIALEMLRDALECFLHGDTEKAMAVVRRDAEVDSINKQLYRELTSYMIERPQSISRALELMFISKSIERIADHATNIAEEMVFLAHAKDIRHTDEVKKNGGASA